MSPPSPLLSLGWLTRIKKILKRNHKAKYCHCKFILVFHVFISTAWQWEKEQLNRNKNERGLYAFLLHSCEAGLGSRPAWLIRRFGSPGRTRKTLFTRQKHQQLRSKAMAKPENRRIQTSSKGLDVACCWWRNLVHIYTSSPAVTRDSFHTSAVHTQCFSPSDRNTRQDVCQILHIPARVQLYVSSFNVLHVTDGSLVKIRDRKRLNSHPLSRHAITFINVELFPVSRMGKIFSPQPSRYLFSYGYFQLESEQWFKWNWNWSCLPGVAPSLCLDWCRSNTVGCFGTGRTHRVTHGPGQWD